MAAIRKALVVGGGIAGMSTAIALRKEGISVDLLEKQTRNAVLGVGIILQGNALRALRTLGVLDACLTAGQPFKGFCFFDANGLNPRVLPGHRTAGPEYPEMLGITRPDYSAILTQAAEQAGARIAYGRTVRTLSQNDEGVSVTLTDDAEMHYDLVVGADGIYSSIRGMVFGQTAVPVYSGQVGWRYNLPRPENVDLLWIFEGPVGKTGFVPLRKDLMYLFLTDQHPDTVPPKGDLASLMRERLRHFGGIVAEFRDRYITDASKVSWKPFELVDLPAPWHRGRVIIIGDAAHASTAHLGQGGAMASEDGIVLSEELGKHATVKEAFEGFMARRYERCRFIQEGSHQICRWEIEKTPNADFVGVTQRAFELVREPI